MAPACNICIWAKQALLLAVLLALALCGPRVAAARPAGLDATKLQRAKPADAPEATNSTSSSTSQKPQPDIPGSTSSTQSARSLNSSPGQPPPASAEQRPLILGPYNGTRRFAEFLDPEDSENFLRENLEPQLQYWQKKAPALTVDALRIFARNLVEDSLAGLPGSQSRRIALALLRNNTLQLLYDHHHGSSPPSEDKLRRFDCLANLVKQSGLTFVDSAFLVNLHDYSLCHGQQQESCGAPLFSVVTKKVNDSGLLLPACSYEPELRGRRWSDKREIAFGRAGRSSASSSSPFTSGAGSSTNSSSSHLAAASLVHPDRLDFAVSNLKFVNYKQKQQQLMLKGDSTPEATGGLLDLQHHLGLGALGSIPDSLDSGAVANLDKLDYGAQIRKMSNAEGEPSAGFGFSTLNSSVTGDQQQADPVVPSTQGVTLDMQDLTHWKYLIYAEGRYNTGRLAKLLLTNSVVLKEDSSYLEYYYRSLKPWEHYVPFRSGPVAVSDVLAAVDKLKKDDEVAREVAYAGQDFAAKFLLKQGRAWYLQQLLQGYNDLFGPGVMAAWLAKDGPQALAVELDLAAQNAAVRRIPRNPGIDKELAQGNPDTLVQELRKALMTHRRASAKYRNKQQ